VSARQDQGAFAYDFIEKGKALQLGDTDNLLHNWLLSMYSDMYCNTDPPLRIWRLMKINKLF
jgi:hypothetical protein